MQNRRRCRLDAAGRRFHNSPEDRSLKDRKIGSSRAGKLGRQLAGKKIKNYATIHDSRLTIVIFAAMKILMVCLGNICRSPLAEGILKQKVKEAGLDWTVESAGTGNWHIGDAPHHLSQKVAKANGIDICNQKGRQFVKEDMLRYDKILVMDEDNYAEVKRISGALWKAEKVDLLLNYSYPGENRNVPDPWYGKEDGFNTVFEMISRACERLVDSVVSQQSSVGVRR